MTVFKSSIKMNGRPISNRRCRVRGAPSTAFTLAELVIVIAIIGVIAAIALPRFGSLSRGADEVSLKSSLHTIRESIQMYAAEHNGVFPALDKKRDTFIAQLTAKTDIDGNVGTTAGVHIFGPYLHNPFPAIPVGPNVGATKVYVTDHNPPLDKVDENITDQAWIYHHLTGEFIPNTDDLDSNGTPYTSY